MARKPRGLTAKIRPDTGRPYVAGTVRYPDGTSSKYIYYRAASDDLDQARLEARRKQEEMEAEHHFGGPKGGADQHTLDEALKIYLKEGKPNEDTLRRLDRISEIIVPETKLKDIDQDTVNTLEEKLFTKVETPAPSTVRRAILVPLKAVLQKAVDRGWMVMPKFNKLKMPEGRTEVFTPEEAERLIAAAAPHLQALIIVLLCTGMRLSEALYLKWGPQINLKGGFINLWGDETKGGKRRVVWLTPRAIDALSNLPHRTGVVFLTDEGEPYKDTERRYGGQIKRAWRTAKKNAGLADPKRELTPHTCRHTWASYHYAVRKDLLLLQLDGGWSELKLVARYAHIMDGYEDEVLAFLGGLPGRPERVHRPAVAELAVNG
jgi:integrase